MYPFQGGQWCSSSLYQRSYCYCQWFFLPTDVMCNYLSVLNWQNTTIWVRSRNCGCLVTWFYYQLIAKPGNKTAAVLWPDPYDDVMTWKHIPYHWPFVWGIHPSPLTKDRWFGPLMLALLLALKSCWTNCRVFDDLRRHEADLTSPLWSPPPPPRPVLPHYQSR